MKSDNGFRLSRIVSVFAWLLPALLIAQSAIGATVASEGQTVAAGDSHSLFVKADSTLWATGYNFYGQLGNGTNTSRTTATQVATGVQACNLGVPILAEELENTRRT